MTYFRVERNRGKTHRNTDCRLERGEVGLSFTEEGQKRVRSLGSVRLQELGGARYHLGIKTGRILTYVLLEPLVILSEYCFYRRYLIAGKNPFLLSLILNLISIIGGLICQML